MGQRASSPQTVEAAANVNQAYEAHPVAHETLDQEHYEPQSKELPDEKKQPCGTSNSKQQQQSGMFTPYLLRFMSLQSSNLLKTQRALFTNCTNTRSSSSIHSSQIEKIYIENDEEEQDAQKRQQEQQQQQQKQSVAVDKSVAMLSMNRKSLSLPSYKANNVTIVGAVVDADDVNNNNRDAHSNKENKHHNDHHLQHHHHHNHHHSNMYLGQESVERQNAERLRMSGSMDDKLAHSVHHHERNSHNHNDNHTGEQQQPAAANHHHQHHQHEHYRHTTLAVKQPSASDNCACSEHELNECCCKLSDADERIIYYSYHFIKEKLSHVGMIAFMK
jgi:hypothetical protein